MFRAMMTARMRARLHEDERGFTLVESVIAITIMFASLTSLAFTATNGFRYTGYARERQAANGIANQVMEEIRGLAYAKIQQGLTSSVKGTDPNLVTACPADDPGVYRFLTCAGEQIVAPSTLSNVLPLVPNYGTCPGSVLPLCSAAAYPVTYTWRTYVTNNNTGKNPYRVTVMVTWTSRSIASTGTQMVKTQSLFWSPAGCTGTSLTLHPFASPCQPFFFGQASQGSGAISVSGTMGASNSTGLTTGMLSLGTGSANLQQEQVIQIQTSLAGTGTSVTDGAGTRSGGSTAATTTAADGDPANTAPTWSPGSLTGTLSSVTAPNPQGSGTWIKFANVAGDAGSMDAAASAIGSAVCPPSPAAAETDGLGCGGTRFQQAGLLAATGNFSGTNPTVGAVTFAQLAAPASATTTLSDRDVSSPSGIVQETVSRSFGQFDLGGLPACFSAGGTCASGKPAAFGYFVTLTGYTDSAVATAGTAAGAPTATAAGTLKYWNGSSYTSVDLATTPGYTFPAGWSQTVSWSQTSPNRSVVVTMAATGTPGMGSQPTTVSTPSGSGSITRTDVTSSVGSPISGQFTYTVTVNGSTVANLTFSIDLGTITARAVYQAAQAL